MCAWDSHLNHNTGPGAGGCVTGPVPGHIFVFVKAADVINADLNGFRARCKLRFDVCRLRATDPTIDRHLVIRERGLGGCGYLCS
jgi:hypothetical protein